MSTLTDHDPEPSTQPDPERRRPSRFREALHRLKGYLAVLVALAVLLGGGYLVYAKGKALVAGFGETPDYPGPGRSAVTVKIPDGTSVKGIGTILAQADVIKSTKAWTAAVKAEPQATSIQAGSYAMKTQLPAHDAMSMLLNPARFRIRSQLTINEGLTLSQQVDALAKGSKIAKKSYTEALKNPVDLGLPGYAGKNPEGVLFPQTYEVTDQTTATTLLRQMSTEFSAVANGLDITGRSKALKISPYQAVIVASIIEKEVNRPEDRAKVARVIYNRLAVHHRLEMDSTIHYATGRYASRDTTLEDRKVKSPYNTYQHAGLPPGPISAPGQAALEAALNPTAGPWLYFVVVNPETGETKFAVTPKDHLANVKEYRSWCSAHAGKCA